MRKVIRKWKEYETMSTYFRDHFIRETEVSKMTQLEQNTNSRCHPLYVSWANYS